MNEPIRVTKINGGYKQVKMAKKPIIKENMPTTDTDKQILRMIMMAELDTQNLYEQLRCSTGNKDIQALIDTIMEEECNHFDMAEDMLEQIESPEEDIEEED
jgi:rubrerythrin